MGYNFEAARAAGVSDTDIVEHLKQKGEYTYKFDDARQAGVSDTDIVSHLMSKPAIGDANAPSTNDTLGRMQSISATPIPKTWTEDPSLKPDQLTGDEASGKFTTGLEGVAAGLEGVAAGAKRLPLGVAYLGQEGLNMVAGQDINKVNEWIATNEQYIKDNNLEGEALGGEIIASLGGSVATVGMKSALKIGATEAALEGTISKGTGETNIQALNRAAIAGTLVGVATGIINKLSGASLTREAEEVYQYVKDFNNISDSEADNIITNWLKVMDEVDSPQNRAKAIIDSLGDKGAQLKKEAAAGSPSATKEIEGEIKARREEVSRLFEEASNIETTAREISEGAQVVKDNYDNVKKVIQHKEIDKTFAVPDALDEATTGDVAAIKILFNSDTPMTSSKIIDAMPHINSILRRTKGTTLHNWTLVKEELDGTLKDSLSAKEYNMWSEVNADYSKMANVQTSRVGKIMSDMRAGKITPEIAIRDITALKATGENLFKDIEFLIGTEKTAGFERALLKEAFGKNSETVDWAHMARNMDKNGFVTEEGKALKKVIDDISASFLTDDVIQSIPFKQSGGLQAGISDDLWSKLKFSIVGKTFTSLVKHIPFNETSKHMLRMDQLAGILKSPSKVKDLMTKMDNLAPGVKRKLIEDEIKLLEHKSLAKQTGDVNLSPLTATKSGTISENISEGIVKENSDALISDFISKAGKGDDVVAKAQEVLRGKRVQSAIKTVGDRMKSEDIQGNIKMLQRTVTTEAEALVKEINRQTGVKLPKEEAEKIIKLKLKELMEECNGM